MFGSTAPVHRRRPRDVPVTNVVAMLVMLVTMLPILGAYYLTRGGDSVAGSGK